MSERDISRIGTGENPKPPIPVPNQTLLNSKSVPALHHVGNMGIIFYSNEIYKFILILKIFLCRNAGK